MESTSKRGSKPVRGILKTSKSDTGNKGQHHSQLKSKEAAHFDEMNILSTYHPSDKDYGHMKIDEPKTPYRHEHDDAEADAIDPEELARRLDTAEEMPQHRIRTTSTGNDDEDDNYMTPKAREHKAQFETARKKHYNMKDDIRRAKELLAKEMAEENED